MAVSNWLSGARVVLAKTDGGSMLGGSPRATWHTTENDPTKTSALAVAKYLNTTKNCVHIVWNPVTGEIVQMIPANRAGRGLKNKAGGAETNRKGSINIQIEVVARAAKPFTATACKNLDKIVAWLRSHGVKDAWPSGWPKAYPDSYGLGNGTRSAERWNSGGHFGHSQVPENAHGDPGAINAIKIATAGRREDPKAPALGNVTKSLVRGTYRVRRGDTLWELSSKYGVTVAAIKAANGKKDDLLNVGDILKIPSKAAAPRDAVKVSNVQFGKSNSDVRQVQAELRKLVGLASVDGDFGPKTRDSWKRFQAYLGVPAGKRNGIPTKSGIEALGFRNVA